MLSVSSTKWSIIHTVAFKVHNTAVPEVKVWSFSTFAHQLQVFLSML